MASLSCQHPAYLAKKESDVIFADVIFAEKAEKILRRRRNALRRAVYGELSQLDASDERSVGDLADAAIDGDYKLITSNLAELESRELARVEHALERLRAGQYGICEGCQRPIPVARLQALPHATTCVKCQQKYWSRNAVGLCRR